MVYLIFEILWELLWRCFGFLGWVRVDDFFVLFFFVFRIVLFVWSVLQFYQVIRVYSRQLSLIWWESCRDVVIFIIFIVWLLCIITVIRLVLVFGVVVIFRVKFWRSKSVEFLLGWYSGDLGSFIVIGMMILVFFSRSSFL